MRNWDFWTVRQHGSVKPTKLNRSIDDNVGLAMDIKKSIFTLSISLLASACGPAKEPVEKLSFEQLETVVKTCRSTGKIATDDYCKEATAVYEPKALNRHEKERVAKALADHGVPFTGYSKK